MEKITTGKFGTNTYIIDSKDECILIDPGYNISEYLDKIKKFKVVGILLTHCHCDHVDSIGLFDCPIFIHESDFDGLKNDNSLYKLVGDKPSYEFGKLNLRSFKDKDILDISRFSFEIIHTPGHTKGSSCFLYKDILFTGDTLFKESIGRTDFPSGDHKSIIESIKKVCSSLDSKTRILPGHGEETTIKDELRNNLFLKF